MDSAAEVVEVGELGHDASSILARVRASQQPFVVMDHGEPSIVMVNVASYERIEHERLLLRSLLRGEREIATGLGYDLDEVLAEADALLDNEPA